MASEAEAAPEEEQEEEECPKCPPVGAPAWMATFADMATLLMAFFVLILSFAEFNVPKFKQISGSLKNAFGVQRVIPIVEQPKGTTVLSLDFSPSPAPSLTQDMTQQTTDITKPDLEVQTKTNEGEGEEGKADDILKALEDAIARGDIEVQTLGENVVVNFTATDSSEQSMPQLLRETLDALEKAEESGGKSEQDVLFGGLEEKLEKLLAATEAAQQQQDQAAQAENAASAAAAESTRKAQIAEDEMKIALRQEIGQGLVDVQREEDKVIITVGSGGAFASGSAELTADAIEVMNKIAGASSESKGMIKVSGHTDDVPLIFGSAYRDNWDLAAARSASVVQALQNTGVINGERLEAISYGEEKPVDSNDTEEGRQKNRRIEIEINY
ncbi:MAG: flagellar motor protein MotB [Candidatus Puniceispirillum sp. TMED52]|nr:flagellar motor protein MotB [SAR116 cluster bacterium]OUU46607.1 MAG: flagellar motor protein MotB [Candidatus Puniceispirillum sp. TMED52]HCP18234.1 flagellar motor protein MotB [Alphaproteobacteria bacterium]|tara:strand:- start:726 stop:1883 length:1158 start_codon:yes stop_codon:yes gene_type:complete